MWLLYVTRKVMYGHTVLDEWITSKKCGEGIGGSFAWPVVVVLVVRGQQECFFDYYSQQVLRTSYALRKSVQVGFLLDCLFLL